jgi:hypothetical protein
VLVEAKVRHMAVLNKESLGSFTIEAEGDPAAASDSIVGLEVVDIVEKGDGPIDKNNK